MDTIIVNNQIYPLKFDSIKVNADYSVIVAGLDSLKNQSHSDFNNLRETIVETDQNEGLLKFVSNDALFTTITTILVFSLGILASIVFKWIDIKRKKLETRKFVKHHIDRITDSYCTKLKEAYMKFSNETTIDSGIPLTPPKILSNNFQRILHIDSKELFNSVVNKNALSNVVSQIDFLNSLVAEVQLYHSSVLADNNKFREKLNDKLNQYLNSLADFIEYERQNTQNYENTTPYKTINDSIYKFYTEIAGKRQLQKFYDEILRINQDYLVESNLFREHKVGKEIAEKGKDLTLLFTDLRAITDEFKKQYKDFSDSIDSSLVSLNSETDKINWT